MSGKRLSYVHTPTNYSYSYLTVPDRMQQLARETPDKDVYVFLYPFGRRDSISVGTLFEKSKALAKSLIQLGLKKGDVVATCLPNDKDALISTFGVIFAGGIITHLLLRDEDGTDLQNKLRQIGVKYLVLNPGVNEEQLRACMNFVDEIDQSGCARSIKVPSLKMVITTSKVKGMSLLQLDDLLTGMQNDDVILPRLDPEENIVLFSTSGTTGDCKFIPHTHHGVMIIGHQAKESIGYETQDVLYSERRIAWLGGFPFMLLHDCPKVVTLTHPIANLSEHCRFTYSALLNEKCTIACVFPATVVGLLDMYQSMSDRQILKSIHISGLTLASIVMNAIGVITERVTNCYGLSEGGVITSNHVSEKNTYLEFSTGKPVAGVEIKVVDTDGFIVEREQTGMILARSPSMAKSYYIDGNTTLPAQATSGWVDTKDIGYVTEDGELVVAGRQSDTIGVLYTGGRYMRGLITYLEALIKDHPSVLEVVAITVPDDVFVEIVCACVIPLPGKKLTTSELENFCKSKIVPGADNWEDFERIMLFQSFPKLYTGKPDKRALKEEVMRRKKEEPKK
ncbi:long-chain-fatty-acid--CoA ligase-like [Mercenaria mercenaria]|uniref:long-chain-fatty-acid--CoA ligase-like n=1 Tax=Mercenaria mercenaria TaxID=6596 RepID=UPI00234F0764|nr:long-chain-fatty-acid--CoA ligase-like [Mercenaria mercenaria]